MSTNNSGAVRTSVARVQTGIELCEDNAKRFLQNATILLDHGGSDGLAYVLWSFAVEEFGKAILLRDQMDGVASGQNKCIEWSADHWEKFRTGFNQLTELSGTKLARVLGVTGNASPDDTVIENPRRLGVTSSVTRSSTGLFSDIGDNGEVDPTVALRFALLCVDFQPATGDWTRPGKSYRQGGVVARWEIGKDDVLQAIEVLRRRVEALAT